RESRHGTANRLAEGGRERPPPERADATMLDAMLRRGTRVAANAGGACVARRERDSAEEVVGYFWGLGVRGALALVFGMVVLLRPVPSLATLTLEFGMWVASDGVAALGAVVRHRGEAELVLEGVTGITIGILAMLSPDPSPIMLSVFFATWAMCTGTVKLTS